MLKNNNTLVEYISLIYVAFAAHLIFMTQITLAIEHATYDVFVIIDTIVVMIIIIIIIINIL